MEDQPRYGSVPAAEDLENTPDPVCPHCGHIHLNWFGWGADGTSVEVDCRICKKPFNVLVHRTITFSTTKK